MAPLELCGERDCAANVAHVVIKYVLVGIAVRERTDRADRAPIGDAVSSREGKNLAQVSPTVLVVIASHHAPGGVNGKCPGQTR